MKTIVRVELIHTELVNAIIEYAKKELGPDARKELMGSAKVIFLDKVDPKDNPGCHVEFSRA